MSELLKIENSKIAVTPTGKRTKDGSAIWRVDEAIVFQVGQFRFTVPGGFEFDFASVPRALKFFLRDDSIYGAASLAHDWLYYIGAPKGMADGIFLDLLRAQGVPTWQRVVIVEAVALFGGAAYRAHRKAGHCAEGLTRDTSLT